MFCLNCGTQLPDGSNFCNNCGAAQTAAPASAAQRVVPPQQPVFPQQPVYPQQGFQQPAYAQPVYAPQPTGALLFQAGNMTRYNGGKALGTVTGSGDVTIYDDRIEFYKKTGDQRGYALGPIIGAVVSINGAKKNPVDTYRFQDIKNVRKGKYAGLKETIVLELKNGKAVSFVPSTKQGNPDQIISIISQYLR